MKLSARGHYGLRAMAQLAMSYGQGPQSLSEVARAEEISVAFLEQIMGSLRRAGLVEGSRGAKGGYELSRSPAAITVGDILRVLEGPLILAACAGDKDTISSCGREAICSSKNMWVRLRNSIAEVLDSTTLADLCEETVPRGNDSALLRGDDS